jgi:hypothetical protein
VKKTIFNVNAVMAAANAGELSSTDIKKAIIKADALGLHAVVNHLRVALYEQQKRASVVTTFDDGAPREVVESFYEAIATVEHVLKHRLQRTRNMVKQHGVLGTITRVRQNAANEARQRNFATLIGAGKWRISGEGLIVRFPHLFEPHSPGIVQWARQQLIDAGIKPIELDKDIGIVGANSASKKAGVGYVHPADELC